MHLLLLLILLPQALLLARIGVASGAWVFGDWIASVGFLIEGFTVVFVLLILLQCKKWWGKLAASLLIAAYVTFLSVQSVSFGSTGGFLPWIAFENMDNISMLLVPRTVVFFVVALLYALLSIGLVWRLSRLNLQKQRLLFGVTVMLALLTCLMPHLAKEARPVAAHGSFRAVPDSPPALSMIRTLLQKPDVSQNQVPLEVLQQATQLLPQVDMSQPYPLVHDRVYNERPASQTEEATPNVLIIFLEGISTRLLSAYDDTFPDLMPAVSQFAREENSLVVQDYYSHTAATFRGLHGQLCSIYPGLIEHGHWHQEYRANFFCLTDLFTAAGYQTTFLDPHYRAADHLFAMMEQLNFDAVLTADEITTRYLENSVESTDVIEFKAPFPPAEDTRALADEPMFAALTRATEGWDEVAVPQMLALYLFGTHAWLDTPEDHQKYGDGQNRGFNAVHQQDQAFGQFWRNFRDSPAAENTVVILTADHARYHEPQYVQALLERGATDYQIYFTDRIPLIIHDPRGLPQKTLEAHFATSIDFAPTIADYLRLPNLANPFQGQSLFSRQTEVGLVNIGNSYFLTADSGIYDISQYRTQTAVALRQRIQEVHGLMQNNRIWPE